jgi:hypothetical protein
LAGPTTIRPPQTTIVSSLSWNLAWPDSTVADLPATLTGH